MEQPTNNKEIHAQFTFPSLEEEEGEVERVAGTFNIEDKQLFKERFYKKALETSLTDLSESHWAMLENTDSYDIRLGDWDAVREHAEHFNRDWKSLKSKMESGQELDAPIIVKIDGKFHLVSGNTRLMVSRALGVGPKVLVVDLSQ